MSIRRDGAQVRRIVALALVVEGASRLEAARQSGVDLQTLRDWMHWYNEAGIDCLASRPIPGRPRSLTTEQMQQLREVVLAGSGHELHRVARWLAFPRRLSPPPGDYACAGSDSIKPRPPSAVAQGNRIRNYQR